MKNQTLLPGDALRECLCFAVVDKVNVICLRKKEQHLPYSGGEQGRANCSFLSLQTVCQKNLLKKILRREKGHIPEEKRDGQVHSIGNDDKEQLRRRIMSSRDQRINGKQLNLLNLSLLLYIFKQSLCQLIKTFFNDFYMIYLSNKLFLDTLNN